MLQRHKIYAAIKGNMQLGIIRLFVFACFGKNIGLAVVMILFRFPHTALFIVEIIFALEEILFC
jgi:hypothetical protein